ncbi:tetratricopeptide repeat-containing sulfotransferase family protein [Xanthomonas sacchari]|uniref:tetratricopeptide repeat-containing sulfotransferase family protein n=1 Tax=Xanthomonas sacchari TaxID=56458 RepID=UPI002252CB62|nr:tetratricopeptide repeat-containing sulfotransferase family protein [Xanthomonas sacchari]MCW0455369.1 hypothetical protein [Xanthomonas sacchari]
MNEVTAASLWSAAQAALARRDLNVAAEKLRALLELRPGHGYARVLLAGTVLAEGRVRAAASQLLQAAADLGDDIALRSRVGQALLRVGEHQALHELLRHPTIATCRDGSVLTAFAHLHQQLGEHAEALALMLRARACGFDGADFRYFLAVQFQFNGRLQEAAEALDATLRASPGYGRAALSRARLRRYTGSDNHIASLRAALEAPASDSENRAGIAFALYKELEDLGDTDAAWAALQHGNALMHARLRHDADADRRWHERLGAAAREGVFSRDDGHRTGGPRPIFVLGLPRSGTTVLERMLGNHRHIVSAGELYDFPQQLRWCADRAGRGPLDLGLLDALPDLDYAELGRRYLQQTQWRANDAPWFIDKLPANYAFAGAIARALPDAVIVHLVRDPLAVCFSNYRALFGDSYAYSYDLNALAAHYLAYRELMQSLRAALPGRLVEVDYGRMVNTPDQVLAQVLERCRLAVEPGQSDIRRNRAPSATLSTVQVRSAIDARHAEEWRRYAAQLQPLRQALGLRDAEIP